MAADTMYERIMVKLAERKETPGAMCDALGLRRAMISELKTGKTSSLSADKIARVAGYLHVTCDYLILGRDTNSLYSQTEQDLISAWRRASDDERENIAFLLRKFDFTYESPKASKEKMA